MKTVVRFEEECLLCYDRSVDAYEVSEDDLLGFPYEAYALMELDDESIYELYLDEKSQYPTVKEDRWLTQTEVLLFLSSYHSKSEQGRLMQQATLEFYQAYLAKREGINKHD